MKGKTSPEPQNGPPAFLILSNGAKLNQNQGNIQIMRYFHPRIYRTRHKS